MSRKAITLRQAVTLISARLGYEVRYEKARRALRALEKAGRVTLPGGYVNEMRPEDVDRLAGQVVHDRAGWSRQGNVRGDVEAWVETPDLPGVVLMVPYERTWLQAEKREQVAIAETLTCYEWPTGRITGYLHRVGDRDGLLAYVWSQDRVGEAETAQIGDLGRHSAE